MHEDPTKAMPLDPERPHHGLVGPDDPHADPETHPGMEVPHDLRRSGDPATDPNLQPVQVEPEAPTVPVKADRRSVARSRTGGLYAGLIFSAIVMIFLLIFILQNLSAVPIYFLGFSGSLPVGVAMLLSAIAGLLLVAIPGGLRILQLRRVARRG